MWSTTQDKNYDSPQNGSLFDKVNNTCPNFYRGRVVFKYISKKQQLIGVDLQIVEFDWLT
jgi:hypothetical protein